MNIQSNILSFCNSLAQGKSLLYPTDTIWGLGCDATNPEAVEKIYTLKKRAKNKPLIALVSDIEMLSKFVSEVPKNINEIISNKLPTTIIYPKGKGLANGVISENGSVAIRIPKPGIALDIVTAFGKPIVSTSANISEKPIPTTYTEIDPYILAHVDEIVPLDKENIASTPSRVLQLLPDGTLATLR